MRRKRSKVFGIVGQMTEKQARRQLEAILARVNDPGYVSNRTLPSKPLRKNGATKRFQR